MSSFENTNLSQLFNYIQKADKTLEKLNTTINKMEKSSAGGKNDPPTDGGGSEGAQSEIDKRKARLNQNIGRREIITQEKNKHWEDIANSLSISASTNLFDYFFKQVKKITKTAVIGFALDLGSTLWDISELHQQERKILSEINDDQIDPKIPRDAHRVKTSGKGKGGDRPEKLKWEGAHGMPGGGRGDGEEHQYISANYATSKTKRGMNALHGAEGPIGKAGRGQRGPDPAEVLQQAFGEAQNLGSALSTVMSNLNIGAHTFVGGLINGFNTALSIVQAVVSAIQTMQTIGSFMKLIPGFSTGGTVPGFGNTDSIPAMLTPGEFVINKSAVNKLGVDFLRRLNSGANVNNILSNSALLYNSGPKVITTEKTYVMVPDTISIYHQGKTGYNKLLNRKLL